MFYKIILSKENLIHNLKIVKDISKHKICAMIKANAYGHGIKEVISILDKEENFYGVSNQSEALYARKYTDKEIIVFGACEDYLTCMKNDISFALFSYKMAKDIIKLAKKSNLEPKFHLCLNTGMNRYGIKSIKELNKIINILKKYNMKLFGIYTHFSSLTTDKNYTDKQKSKFYEFVKFLPKKWNTITHVGGGNSIFENIDCDMNRVGLEIYGYGNNLVKPVLSVFSQIVDIVRVEKNEHIGYLCGYTANSNMIIATIPLGYGDGLTRKMSNRLKVEIGNQIVNNVGNICMDAFMVDISKIKCKIGDSVTIMKDAGDFAKLIESTEYEVLTNLGKFRGDRIII